MTFLELAIAWVIGKALDQAAKKFGPSSTPARPPRTPPAARIPPTARRPGPTVTTATSAPPWPQVVPRGLPPFPGAGWTPDNPPPPAVVSRAHALLPQLWAHGEGTWKPEQTAGRWIVYRASMTGPEGDKKGVVAFRQSAHAAFLTPPDAPPDDDDDVGPPIVTPGEPVQQASASRPVSSPASTALPTLRRGAKGEEVRIAQRALKIAADGDFGPGTENAVRAFQRSRGLTPDGIIGPITWGALLGGAKAA